jgi:hypothetical protein
MGFVVLYRRMPRKNPPLAKNNISQHGHLAHNYACTERANYPILPQYAKIPKYFCNKSSPVVTIYTEE